MAMTYQGPDRGIQARPANWDGVGISVPAGVDEAEGAPQLRAGKRPRPAVLATSAKAKPRRPFFDEHKWALLDREQELERRRVEEAIRRLDAIEELRRRARERKHDRNRRRLEFVARLELCVLTLQRNERGRQARKVAKKRAKAVEKIAKWMLIKMRRAAILKAVRKRAILQIMISVEQIVEEQLDEAKFFVRNAIKLRAFRTHRSVRIIQNVARRRAELKRQSAAILVCATRCWLARGNLRRARIRRSIRRYPGSLSRRNLGLKESDPFAMPTTRDFQSEGRWWDTGAPAVSRPKWGTLRVEHEEARSRQRALSLADLIRSGQPKDDAASAAAAAAAAAGRGQAERGGHARARIAQAPGGGGGGGGGGEGGAGETLPLPSWRTKRWGLGRNKGGGPAGKEASRGGENSRTSQRSADIPVGFGKRITPRRAASMIDPRVAEKAALVDELERQHAKRTAVVPVFAKLSIVQKHLHREREFHEQREKRRAAAERQALKKEKLRAREIAEAARRRALEAELLEKKEEEKARKRLEKIRAYKEKKAARELTARKALAAQRLEERRSEAAEQAKRLAIEAAFEKEKAERVERARRKRRAEEKHGRKRKDGSRGAEQAQKLPAPAPTHHRAKKHGGTGRSRAALAPIAVTNNNGRDDCGKRVRRAARSSRAANCAVDGGAVNARGGGLAATKGSSTLKVAAGVRDGRRKRAPHGASVPALPVVPGWKAMAAGGTERVENRKRTRRRPPKGGTVVGEGESNGGAGFDGARGGSSWAEDDLDGNLKARNSSADLEGLLSTSAGGGGGAPMVLAAETETGGNVRAPLRKSSELDDNTGAEENLDACRIAQERATTEAEQTEEEIFANGGREEEEQYLAGDESLHMETLDSIFPIPKEGAEIGGGGGLGETSAPGELMSPGWSSRSSRRSSEAGETSSDALSDSAAVRQGKALLSGESAGPAGGWGTSAHDGGVKSAEKSCAVYGAAESAEEERPALPASVESGATAGGDHGRSPGVLVQLPSAAFPDGVSDMSDNQTFIGRHRHHGEENDGDGDEDEDENKRGDFEGVKIRPSDRGRESTDCSAQDPGVGMV